MTTARTAAAAAPARVGTGSFPRTAAPRSAVVHGLGIDLPGHVTVCGRTIGDTWAGEYDAAPVGPITCKACLRHIDRDTAAAVPTEVPLADLADTVPAPGHYTVTPATGGLVHMSTVGAYVNPAEFPDYRLRGTSCGRYVSTDYARRVSVADATREVTCPTCHGWAAWYASTDPRIVADRARQGAEVPDPAPAPKVRLADRPTPAPRPTPSCYVTGYESATGTPAPADDPAEGGSFARWAAPRYGYTSHLVMTDTGRTACGAVMEGGYAHLTGDWSLHGNGVSADACPACTARQVGSIVARSRSGNTEAWIIVAPYGYAPAARVRPGQEVRVGTVRPTWVTVLAVTTDPATGATELRVREDDDLARPTVYVIPAGDWIPTADR